MMKRAARASAAFFLTGNSGIVWAMGGGGGDRSHRTTQERAGSRLAATSLMLLVLAAGCAPVQSRPWHPEAVGNLAPFVKDRDAGLVAAASGFDVTRYRTIAIGSVSVDMPANWSEEDRRIASSVVGHLLSELSQRFRAAGQFERVTDDASMTEAPGNGLRLDVRITALELDRLAPTELWAWIGPGSIQMEIRFLDMGSGQVVLVTADRRTARQQMTQTRDVPGTMALLNEAASYLVTDLVNFLGRIAKKEGIERTSQADTDVRATQKRADPELAQPAGGCEEWKTGWKDLAYRRRMPGRSALRPCPTAPDAAGT